jgi:hypothetical protein
LKTNQSSIISCSDAVAAPGRYLEARRSCEYIILSFNRKNKLDNSCNDEKEKSSEGENKGDKDDQFEANINKSGHELGEGNVSVYVGKMTEKSLHATNASSEECGVDDCEGRLEDNQKPQSMSRIMNAT